MNREGDGSLEADLVAWGTVVVLETVGRRSGRTRRAAIGFAEDADGSLLVAASAESTDWARNLITEPHCTIERGDTRLPCRAERLYGSQAHAAVAELILKYGTPSERLGAGPAFRLRPVPD